MTSFAPTDRVKRRYLLVKGARESIERALLDYLGLLGWSRAMPVFLPASSGMWVCAVERKELVHVRAALALASEELAVLRVSGTLNALGVRIPPTH